MIAAQIVVDPDEDTWKAIDLIWPPSLGASPVVYVCHWHLRDRLLEILRQAGLAANDPLYVAAGHAFAWKERWDDFALLADKSSITLLAAWMKKWRHRIELQLTHQAGRRVAAGPLEQQLTVIRDNFEDRRGSFKNRERLNRLLMLMELDRNGQASETAYAKIIRERLIQQNGYSPPRRQILDPRGQKHSLAV